jgi:hypothetical protein
MLNQPKTITESERLLPTNMVMMLEGFALLADSGTVATPCSSNVLLIAKG